MRWGAGVALLVVKRRSLGGIFQFRVWTLSEHEGLRNDPCHVLLMSSCCLLLFFQLGTGTGQSRLGDSYRNRVWRHEQVCNLLLGLQTFATRELAVINWATKLMHHYSGRSAQSHMITVLVDSRATRWYLLATLSIRTKNEARSSNLSNRGCTYWTGHRRQASLACYTA